MRFVVPAVLLVVAAIHLLPLAGALGPAKLASLYAIDAQEPNLQILLRHRAVLFGLLAALLVYAVWQPALQGIALIGALVSVASFVIVALAVGGYNGALRTVVLVDSVATVLLVVATVIHFATHSPDSSPP